MARVYYTDTTKRNTRGRKQLAAALAQASSPDAKSAKPKSSPHKTPPDQMIKPASTPPKLKRPIRKCGL